MDTLRILITEDDSAFSMSLRIYFKRLHYKIYFVSHDSQMHDVLQNEEINIVLLGDLKHVTNINDLIRKLKNNYPQLDVILMSEQDHVKNVVDVFRAGASDYLIKPFSFSDLKNSIERTGHFRNFEVARGAVESNFKLLTNLICREMGVSLVGVSTAIKRPLNLAARVAKSEGTAVLITGETGTGKELIARAIHLMSNRSENMFHSVNCSSVPESLFEAEFFGHTRGAFTGAISDRKGWFEVSHNSTLFLDEVGELPMQMQAKFLRVLDDKIISRIGNKSQISLDLRVIAATNQNLEKMVDEGRFRIDLYHRLKSFEIHIPPLRDRREDIPELINYFIKFFGKSLDKNIVRVEQRLYNKLKRYNFPGNVRELKNLIEQAMIICDGNVLRADHMYFSKDYAANVPVVFDTSNNYDLAIIEKTAIEQALEHTGFNKSKAALLLNITRQALDRKIIKHGIKFK